LSFVFASRGFNPNLFNPEQKRAFTGGGPIFSTGWCTTTDGEFIVMFQPGLAYGDYTLIVTLPDGRQLRAPFTYRPQ
jgi:hypothetical protein